MGRRETETERDGRPQTEIPIGKVYRPPPPKRAGGRDPGAPGAPAGLPSAGPAAPPGPRLTPGLPAWSRSSRQAGAPGVSSTCWLQLARRFPGTRPTQRSHLQGTPFCTTDERERPFGEGWGARGLRDPPAAGHRHPSAPVFTPTSASTGRPGALPGRPRPPARSHAPRHAACAHSRRTKGVGQRAVPVRASRPT